MPVRGDLGVAYVPEVGAAVSDTADRVAVHEHQVDDAEIAS
jgi:hypothetical protein